MGFDDFEPGAALRQDQVARQGGCPGLRRRADEEQMNRLGGCFARRNGDKGAILKKGGVERREKIRVKRGVPGQVLLHSGGIARQWPQQISQLQIIPFSRAASKGSRKNVHRQIPAGGRPARK